MFEHFLFEKRMAVALVVFSILAVSATAATYTYNAQTQFSSTQGSNGWYYQEWNGTSYSNMTWVSGSSYWQGSTAYCLVSSTGAHPGPSNNAVRTWVSPYAGVIRITGSAYDTATVNGDGVYVKIYKNNRLIWWGTIENGNTTGHDFDMGNIEVAAGDAIYFHVNKGPSNDWSDSTYFMPVIILETGATEERILPHGATLSGTTSVTYSGGVYSFSYSGTDSRRYQLNINNYWVQRGLTNVYETYSQSTPIAYGGVRYRKLDGSIIAPYVFATSASITLQSHSLSGNKVTLTYCDVYEGVTNYRTVTYELVGKTMVIKVASDTDNISANGNYCGYRFDRSEGTTNTMAFEIPYMKSVRVAMVNNSYFYTTYIDKGLSGSNKVYGEGPTYVNSTSYRCSNYTEYEPNSADNVCPLSETLYLTVSATVDDVMPEATQSASSDRADLDDKVVYDASCMAFSTMTAAATELATYGFEDLHVIYHYWQRWGYDTGLPDHYPAGNYLYGTHAQCQTMGSTIRNNGWLFTLHENYRMMDSLTPSSYQYYNLDDVVKDTGLDPRLGWYNAILGRYMYIIRPDKSQYYAAQESPSIHSAYNTNACLHDVIVGWDPSHLNMIDYDDSDPNCRSLWQTVHHLKMLMNYMRSAHEGPLTGEGSNVFESHSAFYGGYADSVQSDLASVEGEYEPIVPDFEIKMVKPRMANQGVGAYGRFFADFDWSDSSWVSQERLDKYNAMTIAYGHIAMLLGRIHFMWNMDNLTCSQYYSMQALQALYMPAGVTPTSITYYHNGSWVDLSTKLKALTFSTNTDTAYGYFNAMFCASQICTQYSNGLKVYVNTAEDVLSVTEGGTTYDLPQYGWLAWKSDGFRAYSALVDDASNTWTASSDFSSTQGYRNWYYQEWTGLAYQNMSWISGSNYWRGSETYCITSGNGGHPGDAYDAARKWVSPSAGTLHITGNAHDVNTANGDGVYVAIYDGDRNVLWSANIANGDTTGYDFDIHLNVEANDPIYFVINKGASNNWSDSTYFNPTIKQTRRIDYVYAPGKYTMINGRGTSTTVSSPSSITGTYFKVVNVGGPTVTENANGSLTVTP